MIMILFGNHGNNTPHYFAQLLRLPEVFAKRKFATIKQEEKKPKMEKDEERQNRPTDPKGAGADQAVLGDVLSLLKIQEDYINFLSEYANKHSEYLRIHGIVPTKKEIDKGQDFRDNIEIYAKKVFEDGKLIEKMKI